MRFETRKAYPYSRAEIVRMVEGSFAAADWFVQDGFRVRPVSDRDVVTDGTLVFVAKR